MVKDYIAKYEEHCAICHFSMEKGEKCFLNEDQDIICADCAEGEEYDE